MGLFGEGGQLAKMSFGVIRKDKEILIFPLLSVAVSGMVIAVLMVWIYFMGLNGFFTLPGIFLLVISGFVLIFINVYFDVAVIGCAMIRFEGGDPTVRDGFRTSNRHLGAIFKWAIISVTVGLILGAIQRILKEFGRTIAWLGGLSWDIATYFAVPVFVYEETSGLGAVKRSVHLLKTTWGHMFVSEVSVGLIFVLPAIFGFVPIGLGIALGGLWGAIIGFIIAIFYWAVLISIISAVDSVLSAALYRFAMTGLWDKIQFSFQLTASPFK